MITHLELPFLDLFQRLRQAGMALSPEQYNLLRQSLALGFGLQNWDGHTLGSRDWEALRQVCRVLWVKPSRNYDSAVFEETFRRYVQEKQRQIRAQQPVPAPPPQVDLPPRVRQWPQVPPRKLSVSKPAAQLPEVPTAAKTSWPGLPSVDETGLHLSPTDLPLSRRTVLDSWRFLRRPLRESSQTELDLDATIHQICQEGYFSDVVMRPVLSKKTELIVLVDDSNVMWPFRPALQPLVEAIEFRQVSPANLYRFTTYADDYLYDWQLPTRAISLDQTLSRMHPRRTIVVIWSEGGALQASPTAEHRQGLITFLTRLCPCLRSLIWLNPLPPHRWQGTLAQEIAQRLDGRMIHLDAPQLLALVKQPLSRDRIYLR